MRRQSTGMKSDVIQRTSSDAGTSSSGGSTTKTWRFGSAKLAIKRLQSIGSSTKEDKTLAQRFGSLAEFNESASQEHFVPDKGSIHGGAESSHHQLQHIVAGMRLHPPGSNYIDTAYKEFFRIREKCAGLCLTILQEEIKPINRATSTTTENSHCRRDNSLDGPQSLGGLHFDQRSSFSGHSLTEVVTGGEGRVGGFRADSWLNPIREWKNHLESMTHAFEAHLAETYKTYERDATPEMVEALFSSKSFRKEAVHRMRNASVTKIMSADPQFFPRYEIRFRNYEKVKQELMDIRRLLQAGESGISPYRDIHEILIAPRGDVVLEFANLSPDAMGNEPALRFRISSHLLADTSPIFARMFDGPADSYHVHEAGDISSHLPPAPVQHFCDDGSEVRLYRMPQLELNHLQSLEILLHAAHNHRDRLEKAMSFEQFVAIAQCCMRYRCTAPLEAMVEQWWLPQWMRKGADDMPDELLIIGYAFGLRQLFTRTSKNAILNLLDEEDLKSKPWPQKIRDRIWAVRCAKYEQLYASCAGALQDYIRPPTSKPATGNQPLSLNELQSRLSLPVQPALALSSVPRCPRGSHWCDASNLGWMMLVYNEMGLLPHVLQANVPGSSSSTSSQLPSPLQIRQPSRSLAQILDMLRSIPSPSTPVHPGSVCDPAPSFRAAIADIYNSIPGLSLYDISGKSHGWALSKNKMTEPQLHDASGLERMASHDTVHSVVTEFPEGVLLRIFGEMRDLRNLQSAALINRAFYKTYKRYELHFMKRILQASHSGFEGPKLSPLEEEKMESKVRKEESDQLKERGFGDAADVRTLRSEEDEEEVSDSSDGDSESDASDATIHNDDMELLTRDPPPPFRPQDADPPPPPPELNRQNSLVARSNSTGSADMATPRWNSLSPSGQSVVSTVGTADYMDEPPMTDEEARRILWPDDPEDESFMPRIVQVPPSAQGLREKFRVGDVPFAEEVEAKTLVDTGDAQLEDEGRRRVGLSKDKLVGR